MEKMQPADNSLPGNQATIIRSAVTEDCQGICDLIYELAAFQGFPSGPETTVDRLRHDGFPQKDDKTDSVSKSPLFNCYVIEDTSTKKLIGYIIFYPLYSTWYGKGLYMEDIYVRSSHRNQGLGKDLLSKVCDYGLKNGYNQIRFAVLRTNRDAIRFYERYDFENTSLTDGWECGQFDENAMRRLAKLI